MKENNKLDSEKSNQLAPSQRNASGGFAFGKLLAGLVAAGVLGGGLFGGKHLLTKEEEKIRKEQYYVAKKSDFLVTVKLTGQLVSTDVEVLKTQLEGQTTIETIVEEGVQVKGPTTYSITEGDTLESIALAHKKAELNIKRLNEELELDWANLTNGTEIQIPGDLLVELDPLSFKERINSQEIAVQRAENLLLRSQGNVETLKLSSELAQKMAENNYTNALMNLDKLKNNTISNEIVKTRGAIANLETDVELAEKNLTAYTKLKELGFVSDLEVLRQESSRDKALHQIKVLKAELEAYIKYDQVSLLSVKELTVDEARVQIEKQKVLNAANMRDALSNVLTNERTLELEKEKLVDLNEQMANTKIYAPQDGTVLYWSDRWKRGEPIMEGSKVYKGQNLIKLPRTSSLKVDLSVPQAKRKQLRVGMRVYVEVEDVKLPGTLSFLSATVDTNRRGHTEKSYFKAEVSIDSSSFPDSVSEGMAVTVEMLVINLEGENQRIKVPNQCVTTRMITEDTPQTGCWVLDPDTGQHTWRPVTIEYSDENFIAVKPENDPGRGLRENELVHLSPLTEAENLNLEEAVMGKGEIDFEKIPSKPLESEEAEQVEGATDLSDKDEGTKEIVARAEKEASEEGSESNGEATEEKAKTEDEDKNSE